MIVIPAIDLRGGRCVRLRRGAFDDETVYSDDPVELATRFTTAGARLLHVVDLDAARGEGSNRDLVRDTCRAVPIPVQVGGGIRTREAIEGALGDGARRVILGTAVAGDAGWAKAAIGALGDAIVVGVDVRAGRAMTHGWVEEGPRFEGLLSTLADAGAARFLVTSISRDGTMEGPDLDLYERVVGLTDRPVLASGGVRDADDLRALAKLGLEGCLVGTAVHTGAVRVAEAVGP